MGEKVGARLKADYWETMRAIFDETKREVKSHVFCSVCKCVFKYDTVGNGTKNLKEHYKICKAGKTLNRFVEKHKKNFTKIEKEKIAQAAVRFCTKDLRPFYALYGNGLMDLMEEVVNVCAPHGKLSRESLQALLPCPNTVSSLNNIFTE